MNNQRVETDHISVGWTGVFHPNTVSLSVISSTKFRSIMLDAIFWVTFIHAQGENTAVAQLSKDLPEIEDNGKLWMPHSTRNPRGTWCISDGVTPDNLVHGQTPSLSHHGYSALEWLWSVRKSNLSSTSRIWLSIKFKGSCKNSCKPQVKPQYYLYTYCFDY